MKGLDQVLKRIKEKGANVEGAIYAAVAAGALVIQIKAAQTTAWHNVSGDLRASIHTEVEEGNNAGTGWTDKNLSSRGFQTGGDATNLRALIGTSVPYGRWLEYGTSKMKPHAWLRPAFDTSIEKARKEMARVFQIVLFKK